MKTTMFYTETFKIELYNYGETIHSKKYSFRNQGEADMFAMGLYHGFLIVDDNMLTGYKAFHIPKYPVLKNAKVAKSFCESVLEEISENKTDNKYLPVRCGGYWFEYGVWVAFNIQTDKIDVDEFHHKEEAINYASGLGVYWNLLE